MTQYVFNDLVPSVDTGTTLSSALNSWKDAVESGHSGSSRPSYAQAGMLWVNTTTNPWVCNIYDGTDDICAGYLDYSGNKFYSSASVTHVTNIISLKAIKKEFTSSVFVEGYTTKGDGGGGYYYYDSTDTSSSDNGGTIIVATDGARWKLNTHGEINVLQFGADKTGASDSSAAFQSAGNVSANVHVRDGTYLVNTAPTFTTATTFIVHANAVLTGAGGASLGYVSSKTEQILQAKSTSSDYASLVIGRKAAHSGGTSGNISCGIRSDVYVGSSVTNYEYGIMGMISNSATAGKNAALYGQGIKNSTGPTFAGVLEAVDYTEVADPTALLVGLEVDLKANGTDASSNRIGIDLKIAKRNSSGSLCVAKYGFRTSNGSGDTTSYFGSAFSVLSKSLVGFDTSEGTCSTAAFRMAQGQIFALNAGATQQISYDGTGIGYTVSGTYCSRLNAAGSISLGGSTLPLTISGTWSTGSSAVVLTQNKPGSSSATTTWLSIIINGSQFWIPAWAN